MGAIPISAKGAARTWEMKAACQILILSEDFFSYTQAVEVCRGLMKRFDDEMDFDIKCWTFTELGDPVCARHAAKAAAVADIVLVALQVGHLPEELKGWMDEYLISRSQPDGALALVCREQVAISESLISQFQAVAASLGMDFMVARPGELPLIPQVAFPVAAPENPPLV